MNQSTAEKNDSPATDGRYATVKPSPNLSGRMLREPLLHFLTLGIILFGVIAYLRNKENAGDRQIVVSAGKIEQLATMFTQTWQRPPNRTELERLVDDFIREEAAYRQSVTLGLDQNDMVIRRRLRQKLEFVAEDLLRLSQPTDPELMAWLAEHPDKFRIEARISFRHVYFNPEKRGNNVEELVGTLVTRLQSDPSMDARERGDGILLEFQYDNISMREVRSLFGEQFADSIIDFEPGGWKGPIRSAYGLHAVFVDQFRPDRIPQLNEVRDLVRRDWEQVRRVELTEHFYQKLLEKYDVVVQWPDRNTNPDRSESR